jgi:hypothetical protein
VTTVASEVSVRFAENSFVGICAAGAINALWFRNADGGAIWLDGKSTF